MPLSYVYTDLCVGMVCLYQLKALELWHAREASSCKSFLPTFLLELDIVLHGGLLSGSVTEVHWSSVVNCVMNAFICDIMLLHIYICHSSLLLIFIHIHICVLVYVCVNPVVNMTGILPLFVSRC